MCPVKFSLSRDSSPDSKGLNFRQVTIVYSEYVRLVMVCANNNPLPFGEKLYQACVEPNKSNDVVCSYGNTSKCLIGGVVYSVTRRCGKNKLQWFVLNSFDGSFVELADDEALKRLKLDAFQKHQQMVFTSRVGF